MLLDVTRAGNVWKSHDLKQHGALLDVEEVVLATWNSLTAICISASFYYVLYRYIQ